MNRTEKFLDYYENRIKEDREASFFVFLTALSKDSDDPQNIFLRGDSGIGKTWVVTNVLDLFDDENVWMLGGLSPTALVHSYGELLDANGNPIEWTEKPTLEQVKEELEASEPNISKAQVQKEYFSRLQNWNDKLKDSKYVVDLNGKLLVFLDAPHIETFNKLRPVLSHDKEEISYRFTDKSKNGSLRTSHVVLKGWPACVFCTTDKNWMEDLATRSLTITPKTTEKKLREACVLVGSDAAFPFDDFKAKTESKMKLVLQCLQTEIENGKINVAVPYAKQFSQIIPLNQPRIMRDLKHLMAFIKLNALVNHKDRPKISGREKPVVLATYEDFKAVMEYFEFIEETTTSGLNAHILNVFHRVMEPLKTFGYPELVAKCTEMLHYPLARATLYVYVRELAKIGYVDEEPDLNDKRKKIISVIRKRGITLHSLRNEFGRFFTLDLFKAWLKTVLELSYEKSLLLNAIPSDKWDNDVEGLFNEYYMVPETPILTNAVSKDMELDKTEFSQDNFKVDENALNSKTSPKQPLNSFVRQSKIIPLTPVYEAEKCETCGEFPVKYEFVVDGQPLRRCQNCINQMKSKGWKFTTLTEID